jgi:hypothetical protein
MGKSKKEIKEIEKAFGVKIKNDSGNFSKKIVTGIILLNVIFTLAVFYAFLRVGSEPTILIGAWFGFTTVELWSLSRIKREEVIQEEDGNCEN